jgi:hypothetical protein
MIEFDTVGKWRVAARNIHCEIDCVASDCEDPHVHYVAYLNGKLWGYYSEDYGFISEHNKDALEMTNYSSEWYIYL